MFKIILLTTLFSLKGEVPLHFSISPSYISSCKNKLVVLSIPAGSEEITLYSYDIDKTSIDSAKIPLGRAPEELSFFGLNSVVCDKKMVYIYDKLGKKINYYNFKGDYIGQFLLTRTPYFMTGNGDYLLLIGQEYIIHINTKSKQMDVKNIEYKEFSPSDMWLGTTYKDTAVFFEGTKMVLLKFNLENAEFLGTYPIKGKKEWSAKVVESKRGNGAISLLPVSSFANILKYKNYYIIQRRDLKENDKNALLLIDDNSLKIEKIIKFPRSFWLISYYPQEDEFFIIDKNRKLAKITPSKLGIK